MKKQIQIKISYNSEIQTAWFSNLDTKHRDTVIIETEHGIESAEIISEPKNIENPKSDKTKFKIIRIADENDLETIKENIIESEKAVKICKEKIKKHKLPMKLINAHIFLEGNKILFHFTSEGRVDFRNLVKDLAAIFRKRIELRQIGVRDEAQILGGHGVCGLRLCCNNCKAITQPVSIKMAKEQNLSLNSVKISGVCGRLLCCLSYEYDTYKEINKQYPKIGSKIWIGEQKNIVKDVNIQTKKIKIMNDNHQYLEIDNSKIKINKITGKKYIEVEKK